MSGWLRRFFAPKQLMLNIILLLSVWALWPSASKDPETEKGAKMKAPAIKAPAAGKKYVLRIAPGPFYMPGTMPGNVGDPLEGFDKVAREFEKLFPDTQIEYVNVPNTLREWLVTQLGSGTAPDILNVNVEDVWQDVQKGWYVPFDDYLNKPNPFVKPGAPGSQKWWDVFKFQTISRGKSGPDDRMYCVVMDMVETGIYYNKDIFDKLGLKPPNDWAEFLALQQKLKDAGYIPMLCSISALADWANDIIFDQLYIDEIPGIDVKTDTAERAAFLKHYMDWDEISFLYEKGFFTRKDPRFVEVFKVMKAWRKYMNADLSGTDLMKSFITQEGAMLWDGSWSVQKLTKDPDINFRWGMFYLPPIPRSYCRFAPEKPHPACYIGEAASQFSITSMAFRDTGSSATSERLKRCVAFLQFLTTPEQTNTVVNECLAFMPNVVGVPTHKELLPFEANLSHDYTSTKWLFTFDLRFSEILQRMLELYLNDGMTQDDFLQWMEKNLDTASKNVIQRKKIDVSEFEKRWTELAPLRKTMEGLPDGVR